MRDIGSPWRGPGKRDAPMIVAQHGRAHAGRIQSLLAAPSTVAIPGGRFRMGSESGRPDEQPIHAAEVAAFRMAITPVAVRQYAEFLSHGSAPDPPPWWGDPDFSDPEQPVVGVSWFDAMRFCRVAHRRQRRSVASSHRGRVGMGGTRRHRRRAPPHGVRRCRRARCPKGRCAGHGAWGRARPTPMAFSTSARSCMSGASMCIGPTGHGRGTRRPRGEAIRGGREPGRLVAPQQRWSSPSARSSLPPESRYADYGFRLLQEI